MNIILKWTNEESKRIYGNDYLEITGDNLIKFLSAFILVGVPITNQEVTQLWSSDRRPKMNNILVMSSY